MPFAVIGWCSLVPTFHYLQGQCARIKLSQLASGMILQNHRRLPVCIFSVKIAALGSLKRATGRIFKIKKYILSKEQAKTSVWFFHQLRKKKCKNHQRMYRKYLFIIISLKKYSSDTIPLNCLQDLYCIALFSD